MHSLLPRKLRIRNKLCLLIKDNAGRNPCIFLFFLLRQTVFYNAYCEQNRTETKKILFFTEQTIYVECVDNHNILWYIDIKKHKSINNVPLKGLIFDKLRTFVLTNKNRCCTIQSQKQNKCSIKSERMNISCQQHFPLSF